jgi:hypothetical protein
VTVHIDRAHHHPRVYKRLGFWTARCDRCGLLGTPDVWWVTWSWHNAYLLALKHSEAHS